MYVMGETLCNDQANFLVRTDEYFKAAFGIKGDKCKEYLKELSCLLNPPYLRGEKKQIGHDNELNFAQIKKVIEDFKEAIEKNININNKTQALSWQCLKYHSKICSFLAVSLQGKAARDKEKSLYYWQKVKEYVQEIEDEVQGVFDVYGFIRTIERYIKVEI